MKFAALLLLVPSIALAQQPPQGTPPGMPQGTIDKAEMLKQLQQHMLPMLQESIPNMEEAKACVAASNNKQDLAKCAEIMRDFQQRMMAKMAPPGMAGKAPPAAPPPAGGPSKTRRPRSGRSLGSTSTPRTSARWPTG